MIINLNILFRNLLIILISIYFAQGAIYPFGSIIAKISLLIILLISSFYLVKTLFIKTKDYFFKYIWALFLLINIVGFLFESNFSGIYYSQIRNVITAILPFFPFYYFSLRGDLSRKDLLNLFLLLLPIAILSFFFNKETLINDRWGDSENVVTNTGYFFVALIPYTFLWKKNKIFSMGILMVLLYFIIQSSKRGALIVGAMGLIIFIFYHLYIIKSKKIFQNLIFTISGFLIVILFLYNTYINNEFLINRLAGIDEGGSGRNIIYWNLWNNWYESNSFLRYLFGFGFVSTILYSGTGNLAHNDWLEVLTNFGLIGVVIYIGLFISIISYILFSTASKENKIIMFTIFLMWFCQTLFSMYYTVSTSLLFSVLIAYLFGKYHCNSK